MLALPRQGLTPHLSGGICVVMCVAADTTSDFYVAGGTPGDTTNPQVNVGFNFNTALVFEFDPESDGTYVPQLFGGFTPESGVLAFALDGVPVPEPTTATLVGLCGLTLLGRRRR